jgi:hypothetical protein
MQNFKCRIEVLQPFAITLLRRAAYVKIGERRRIECTKDCAPRQRRSAMGLILLIVILVLVFGGGGGYYGYNRWGYAGGGGIGIGTILLILVVCWLLGVFH